MYYFLTYEDDECKEVRTKTEPVPFIPSKYTDGECIKDEK